MGFSHSPKIATDGLVFYYDTGNVFRSYKGEPTTNLIPNIGTSTANWTEHGWSGDFVTSSDYPNTFELTATNGWHNATYDFGVSSGGTIYVRFEYKLKSHETNQYNMFVLNGTNLGSYTSYIGTGTQSFEWQTFEGSFTANADTKFAIGLRGQDSSGLTDVMYIRNLQVEQKSHPTPFVNGTRSVTGSLLDMTGNQTINVANSSFTSDALTAFDGSGDYFDLGSDQVFKTGGGWTIEHIVKYDSVAGGYNNLTSPANFIGSDTNAYNSWYWSVLSNKLALWNKSPGVWKYGSTTLQANTWYHTALVCSDDGTSYQMYLNGVPEGGDHTTYSWNPTYSGLRIRYFGAGNSTLRYINGTLPITKIYNRALSASEIQQNYNALKGRFGL